MSWWEIFRRALELFKALLEKLKVNEKNGNDASSKVKPLPEKPTQEDLVRHHRELYRKNHSKRK